MKIFPRKPNTSPNTEISSAGHKLERVNSLGLIHQ